MSLFQVAPRQRTRSSSWGDKEWEIYREQEARRWEEEEIRRKEEERRRREEEDRLRREEERRAMLSEERRPAYYNPYLGHEAAVDHYRSADRRIPDFSKHIPQARLLSPVTQPLGLKVLGPSGRGGALARSRRSRGGGGALACWY